MSLIAAEPRPGTNLPELSVGELARALKRTVEEAYGLVRVRGEISQPKFHGSGHLYLRLKDDSAVIEAVCWRGSVQKLGLRPEDGMEVVVTGRLTTYPQRSQYQLVIETMTLAGQGALLKMLEERKRRLAAEGLFDAARKKPRPYLPEVIGVITSPTGAVIRDILHRLADRFPRRVLLWPVAVQGEQAAAQIAAAIAGFNRLVPGGSVPRPDLLIVARGGGSLEDLMPFNEELVVRAAAASRIPLISAVGHETDTTLIDHAADLRAPTPTAAAEMAVPVRAELAGQVFDYERRLLAALVRQLGETRTRLTGLARGLGDPRALIGERGQRLDDRAERLVLAMAGLTQRRRARLESLALALRHPRERLLAAGPRLAAEARALAGALRRTVLAACGRFERIEARLTPAPIQAKLTSGQARLLELSARLERAAAQTLTDRTTRLAGTGQLLDSYSYKGVLERGFTLVTDAGHKPLTSIHQATPGLGVRLVFHDGETEAVVGGGGVGGGVVKRSAARRRGRESPDQGRLF
ncbi:Exodeoxyribonuclease 7 large subunit [uncultured Gammaproteobacteria bacterium]